MRQLFAVTGGTIITAALFLFMASLVVVQQIPPSAERVVFEDAFRVHDVTPVPPKPLVKAPVKPEQKAMPKMPGISINVVDTRIEGQKFNIPVDPENSFWKNRGKMGDPETRTGIVDESDQLSTDRMAMPIAQVAPQFPRDMAAQGIEGWVKLRFDIASNGVPFNIRLVDAKPRQGFERAAMMAVQKWRYKPAMTNGIPVNVIGQEVVLDFKLDEL